MTVQSKTTLKGYFNTGDIPIEANFADLIDTVVILDSSSNINLNSNGTNILFSTYKGADSDGFNIWIGGGGLFSVGAGGTTYFGSSNVALGMNALFYNTTGYNNVAIGSNCLVLNTSGRHNLGVGAYTLYNCSTGFYNTAIGQGSQQNLTTGYYNTSLGMDTLYLNTTGYKNIAVGEKALYDLNITADDTSGNNTAIGYNTGRGIVTGINNTILGSNVLGLAAALSNNIIIADGGGTIRIQVNNTGDIVFTTPKMGFFSHAAATQPVHIVDATNAADVITRANAIIAALESIGILASA